MSKSDETIATAPIDRSAPLSSTAVREWLKARRIEEVECAVADIAGVARGKAMPAAKFAELKPTFLPVSIFFQDITGAYIDFEGDQDYTEGDLMMVPDLATVRTAPWAKTPTAQVLHDAHWQSGREVEYAPRNVLKRVLRLYEKEGWQPVVAPEIEFYLTPRPTPIRTIRSSRRPAAPDGRSPGGDPIRSPRSTSSTICSTTSTTSPRRRGWRSTPSSTRRAPPRWRSTSGTATR